MKKILFFIAALLVCTGAWAQDITGNWVGTLAIQGISLKLVFHIEKTSDGYSATMDSPDQGGFGLPTSHVAFDGNRLELSAGQLGLSYSGTLANDSINGIFRQGGLQLPLVLKRSEQDASPTMNRPQNPHPPFPYDVKDVTFRNNDAGVTLAGTLTLPKGQGPFPAVVLIAGSGPNDRDETIFGHKPFLVLADHLTRHGFAVLRYDKRGIGASTGDYAHALTFDFAQDAAAAVRFLRERKDIDRGKVALIGHSEGGVIAPMVAAQDDAFKAIVLMAGTGVKGIEVILYQNEVSMTQQNLKTEDIEKLQRSNREIFESLSRRPDALPDTTVLHSQLIRLWEGLPPQSKQGTDKDKFIRSNLKGFLSPWYRHFLALNPSDYLLKVKCPVLALNGENDRQVSAAQNLQGIATALQKGGNKHVTVRSYPRLNHLFQESQTGYVDEYARIEQTLSPQVLEDITNWIRTQNN